MGAYRALPSRRRFIPKADGTQRPLGIAALEDKIVEMAIVLVLSPIYESDFLGFSYGFRPKRSQHDALDALAWAIKAKKVGWILDADISRFFDTIDHQWMIRFIKHRVGDRRIIRLIQNWLKAGVMDGDQIVKSDEGTPQGAVISPLLANVFLHYVYDLWAHQWRKRDASGDVVIIRYADDTIVGFQHYHQAIHFLTDLKRRLESFGLSLHPKKTRLLEFGKYAAERRRKRGQGKPETFDFLGFKHICGTKESREGFQLRRKTPRKRMQAKLQEIKAELRRHVHAPIDEQGRWLASVVRGFFAYYAVPTNSASLCTFLSRIKVLWIRRLRRRSQRHRVTWARMQRYFDRYLPKAKITHPWPEQRFRVKYSR
jgi:RNA-directed DNA polymerase